VFYKTTQMPGRGSSECLEVNKIIHLSSECLNFMFSY
jgi:hypothetical protein